MTTLADITRAAAALNAQQRRGGVSVYSPGRVIPAGVRGRAAPPRQPVPVAPPNLGGGGPLSINPGSSMDRYLQQQGQQQQQEQAQKEAEQNLPIWKKGLGYIVGNPIVKNAILPLAVMGTARKAIELGVEEAAKHMTDKQEGAVEYLLLRDQNPIGGIFQNVDEERTKGESNWGKLAPNSDYGYGSFQKNTGNKWMDRTSGFAVDTATDPLMYVTGGTTKMAPSNVPSRVAAAAWSEKAPAIADAMRGLEEAQAGAKGYQGVAEVGMAGAKIDAATEAARQAALAARQPWESMPGLITRVHGGRAARVAELARLDRENPQLIEKLAPDILKAGRRGLPAASPELREALDLMPPRLNFMGAPIPGSQIATGPWNAVRGVGASAYGRIPHSDVLARGMKGTEEAIRTLTRPGTPDIAEVGRSLAQFGLEGDRNLAANNFTSRMNATLRKLRGDVRDAGGSNVALTRAAEQPGDMTILNDFYQRAKDVYKDVTGRDLDPFTRPADSYVPHMMTDSFKRMLRDNKNKADVQRFVRASGFQVDDLLEGSGFLEHARVFAPNADGTANVIKIGDKEITLSTGTIDELNQQLKTVFPGFNKDFYETDPIRIGERYIGSVARQAGRDYAVARAAESASPYVRTVSGDLGEAFKAHQASLDSQQNLARSITGDAHVPGREVPKVAPSAPQVGTPESRAAFEAQGLAVNPEDFFKAEKNQQASHDLTQAVKTKGQRYARALKSDVSETVKDVRTSSTQLRKDLMDGLSDVIKETDPKIKALDQRIEAHSQQLTNLGKVRAENIAEHAATRAAIEDDISNLEREIKNVKRRFGAKKLSAERAAVQTKLEDGLTTLRRLRDEAITKANDAPPRMRAELKQRLANLTEPVRRAQNALDRTIAAIPGRPSPESLQHAEQVLAGAEGAGTDKLRAELAAVMDSIDVAQLKVRPSGGLTAAARREIAAAQQRAAELEAEIARLNPTGPLADRSAAGVAKRVTSDQRTSIGKARRVMEDEAAWQAKVKEATTEGHPREIKESKALRQARDAMAQHQEAIVLDANNNRIYSAHEGFGVGEQRQVISIPHEPPFPQGTYQDITIDPATGRPAARPPRTEVEATNELGAAVRGQKHEARARNLIAETATREQRLAGMAAGTPPPERGMVRLFRGEALAPDPGAGLPAWMAGNPELAARDAVEGRWYHPSADVAGTYPTNRDPGVGNRVMYVDIPRKDLAKYQQLDDATKALSRDPGEAVLPKEVAAQAKEYKPPGFDVERDLNVPEAFAHRRDTALAGPTLAKDDAEALLGRLGSSHQERLYSGGMESVQVATNLAEDMAERAPLVAKREQAVALNTVLKGANPAKGQSKTSELEKVLDDIGGVAAANPHLDNDSLKAAESLLQTNREGLQRAVRTDIRRGQADRLVEQAGKGNLAPVMLTMLNDNWEMVYKGSLKEGDHIVDAELYRRFENLYELAKQPTPFGRLFNALTNVFKTYATLSPGFHVRNALSAIFMNTSDGVSLAHQLEGVRLWRQWRKGGEEWLATQPNDVQMAFKAAFGSGAGGRFTEAGVAATSENPLWSAILSNRVTRSSQRVGERVEGSVRLGMALDSVRNGEDVMSAMNRINRVHFDYGQVSKLDEVAKRYIPFWTFMSRNLPLQVTQMWTRPGAYAAYNSFVRNFKSDPVEYTPAYWLKGGAFNTGGTVPNIPGMGGAQGLPIYASPDLGFTRVSTDMQSLQNALGGDVGQLASNLNPIGTAPLEYLLKKDFYTGRNYKPTDYSTQKGALAPFINALSLVVPGARNEAGQVSDSFVNSLKAINPVLDRATRLAPAVTTGGGSERLLESWLRFAGAPVRIGPTEQQQLTERRNQFYNYLDEQKRQQAMLGAAS